MNRQANGGPRPADVLVIFGITGDLARVMTFRSLYRLESRGLLDCPIVGILLGIALFDERLSRPGWHVLVACIGLGMSLVGAVVISLAREGTDAEDRAAPAPSAATA